MRKFIIMALLSVYAFSLTVSDIEVMRESGVLVAFPHEKTPHTILKSMKPSEIIKVKYIKLNNQSLYFMPPWLPKMTNLVRLELKNTKLNLKELAKLKTLTKLNTLDISDNPLFKKGGSLVDFLSAFSLSELYLANTGGSSSDYKNIGSIKSLIKLDLFGNSIVDIDDLKLQKLTRLKELCLANNSIGGTLDTRYLPKNSLVELNLSGNKIKEFGFSGDFPVLQKFNISKNNYRIEFAKEYDNPYLFSNMKKSLGGQGWFNSDIVLPKSIMSRLEIKDKWMSPKSSICKNNGGGINQYGICKSKNWEIAKKICKTIDGKYRLPTISELKVLVKKCKGIAVEKYGSKNVEIIKFNNIKNKYYQSCYYNKGFLSLNPYWSYKDNSEWFFDFKDGSYLVNIFKSNEDLYVRCVKDEE